MLSADEIEARLSKVNRIIPVHRMADGFWILDYSDGRLTITCSFNRLLYREFDIHFDGVTFFSLPARWDDSNVPSDELFRPSDQAEFAGQQPEFAADDKVIFALELVYFPPGGKPTQHTFFIAADDVTAEKCRTGDASPITYYTDPFAGEPFPCRKNRVS